MATLGKITRRAFLISSAAVAGGVAFGVFKYQQPYPNPLTDSGPLPQGSSVMNPYLIIDQSGFTIITPRAEMGQGVHTTLAALVAEELDVRWEDVRAEHGPPGAAYFNEAMFEDMAPFASFDESTTADIMRGTMGVTGKFLGAQGTGGSSSTKDAYEKMRLAGAAARVVLIEAAARRWEVDAKTLTTADGVVSNPATGDKLSYIELAAEAAGIEPPAEPPLKDRSQWRYLGKSMPRLDMIAKSTGTAQFGIDVREEGMLHATVRRNPRLGGVMKSFDASAAEAMKGVHKVVDIGDGVAVVADNTWRAFQAAAAVKFDWGEAPYPATSDELLAAIGEAIGNADPDGMQRDDGDVNGVLGNAAKVVEAEYRVPFLAHATMEPMNAVARLANGRLDIWAGHQAPTQVRDLAAAELGLAADQVFVHVQLLGGGFGRRSEADFVLQAVKVARAVEGRPVKVTWSREEDTRHDFYRPAAVGRFRGAMGEAGLPDAMQLEIASPSVMRSFGPRNGLPALGPDKLITEGASDQPYAIPNYRVVGYDPGLKVPLGFWRSVGASYNSFFHECFLDELAIAGGVDPMQMRIKLTEAYPVANKLLRELAEMSGWGAPLPQGRGRGVAMCLSFGTYAAQVIEVTSEPMGIRIDKVYCVADVGVALDPRNLESQMISGIVFGLSAAVMGEITFEDGAVVQSNFHDYDALRMRHVPEIEVKILENGPKITGAGEPGTPPSPPALGNAIYAATGNRIRELPMNRHVRFV